jgi:flagellar biosynthesis/type III secretory pathway protein FliH
MINHRMVTKQENELKIQTNLKGRWLMNKASKKRKPNKAQRTELRMMKAQLFQEGFDHAWELAYAEGYKAAQAQGRRNTLKFAHMGR